MHKKYDPTSKDSIKKFADLLRGTCLVEYLPKDFISSIKKGKGDLGNLIEKYYFGKEPDNKPIPDFPEAGVELKATPIKRLKKGSIRAKERLVLGMINYSALINEKWEESSFVKKNSLLLLIFYLYEKGKLNIEYVIEIVEFFSFLEHSEDLQIIKSDWEFIKNKVQSGKAHELSEGDTLYLGACTKGATAESSFSEQPNSQIKAKRRAFSFKQGYINFVLEKIRKKNPNYERLFSNTELTKKDFKETLVEKFRPYVGRSAFEIGKKFNLKFTGQKNYYALLSNRILGVKNIKKVEEFQKANIELKTIRVTPNNSLKEGISFPAFKFKELVEETWEESELYNLLEYQKFFFVIFRITTRTTSDFNKLPDEDKNKFLVLEKVVLWNTPARDIEEKAKKTWEDTTKIIKRGVILTEKGNKTLNNLPSSSQTDMIHVRPHGRNKSDTDELPNNGGPLTKQCFWFNKKYIEKELGL